MSSPAVIIRLQNLPLEARSVDIRKFFDKLLIPDGGVHIIGGEKGDAFIAFQSDEDARIAMSRNGYYLCNTPVKLYLSSKQEMQTVIAAARNQHLAAQQPQQPITLPNLQQKHPDIILQPNLNQKPPMIHQQQNELLSSLTKYISTSSSTNGNNYSTSNNSEKFLYDQLTYNSNGHAKKALISMPPPMILSQPPPAIIDTSVKPPPKLSSAINADGLGPLLNDILLKTNKAPSSSVHGNGSVSDKSISIDQILSLLQAHKSNDANSNSKENGSNGTNNNQEQYSHGSDSKSDYFNNNNHNNRGNGQNWNSRENTQNYKSNYSDEKSNNNDRNGSNQSKPYNNNYNNNNNSSFKRKSDDYNNNRDRPDHRYNSDNNSNNTDRQSKYQRTDTLHRPGGPPPLTHSNPPPSSSQSQNLDPIIKVKNFQTNCSYKDIRTFLQGIQIDHDGIKLLSDSIGQRNGSAFVKLMTITDLKKALCRNGQFYEDLTIYVTQSNESEFSQGFSVQQQTIIPNPAPVKHQKIENEAMNVHAGTPGLGYFLKIYGLPAGFDEIELKNMFNNVGFVSILTSQATPITSAASSLEPTVLKAKKICIVATQLDLEKALTRQNERVGKSKLQIFQMNRIEFDKEINYINRQNQNFHKSNYNSAEKLLEVNKKLGSCSGDVGAVVDEVEVQKNYPISDDLYIYMSGVPFSVKSLDVKTFFQLIDVVEAVIIHDLQTVKPTGECICQLAKKQDRDLALEKSDQLFRNRVVKIKPLTYVEYQQYISLQDKIKVQLANKRKRQDNAILPTPLIPPSSSNGQNNNNSLMGNNYNNNRYQNNNYVPNKPFNNNYTKNQSSSSPVSSSSTKPSGPSLIDLPPLPPELQKYRNSLVLLSNVSFDASREDILDLLKRFQPIDETLKIRHDEQGQPTGDAIVACANSEDALRACTDLNGRNFMGLEIKTALVSS